MNKSLVAIILISFCLQSAWSATAKKALPKAEPVPVATMAPSPAPVGTIPQADASADGFYHPPSVLNGDIVSKTDNKVLYKYVRAVGPDGTVKRQYDYLDGKPAALDTVTYTGGKV